MAEDKLETREMSWRQLVPWTELFRGFQIALDLNKLLLAAAGNLVTACGWWLLSAIFSAGYGDIPGWEGNYVSRFPPDKDGPDRAWIEFKKDRDQWNIMAEAAGFGGERDWVVLDLAQTKQEALVVGDAFKKADGEKAPTAVDRDTVAAVISRLVRDGKLTEARGEVYKKYLFRPKRTGTLATMPWFEDRGPNPYLLVTGQAGVLWEPGHFWEWFSRHQAPVMVEPLVKLLQPVVYFLNPRADGLARFYFLCIILWTLATWSLFGGAITRIAVVQVARGERIGLSEALRFTVKRLLSYVAAPLFPLLFVFVLLVFMCIFGLLFMIPVFGDIVVAGLLWFVMIAFGLGMAIALLGLVGWPLMPATISAEGTDSWEAVSRSYSYVYQRPWQYIWYGLVAVAYGGVIVFFIGFLGSFSVYLSKWGVSQTPWIQAAGREPPFLFVYAPTSFGWRTLLLEGVKVDGVSLVQDGKIDPEAYKRYLGTDPEKRSAESLTMYNRWGAFLVAVWLYILFLLILGFGYSFFWSAATIIYFLLRKQVDAAEMDEVYLEEEDLDGPYGSPTYTPPPAAAPRAGGTPLAMVDAPALRPAPTAAPPAPAPGPASPATGDGPAS